MITPLKSIIVRAAAGAARSRGYELIPRWRLGVQPLAEHLRQVFDHYQIDCVFDVGGNLGQFHDFVRNEVGFQGTIISFEPVQKYIDHLQARAASDPKWFIEGCALGAEEKSDVINVTKSPGLNSFLPTNVSNLKDFWHEDSISGRETVQIMRLDSVFDRLLAEHGFSRPYLKIDTQGFDMEVVRGAGNYLDRFYAMQTEASVLPIYKGQPRYPEVISSLTQLGFDLSGMFAVAHDKQLRLVEFDCVMVRHRENGRSNAACL